MSSTHRHGSPSHLPNNILTQPISQDSLASTLAEQHQLTNALQVNKVSLDEVITQLKIRIAVLENELAHAKKEKYEAVKSSVIIARALSGFVSGKNEASVSRVGDEARELQWENRMLRRENGVLWERIEDRGGDLSDIQSRRKDVEREARNDVLHGSKQLAGPKESMIGEEFGLSSSENQRRASLTTVQEVAGTSKQDARPKDVVKSGPTPYVFKHQVEARSFESGSTTVLSTPLLASEFSNNSRGNQPLEQCQGRPEVRDVGIRGLDEILNDTFSAPANKSVSRSASEFTDIDTAVEKQHQALATFQNFPVPNVITTGVDISCSRRGEDYAQGKISPEYSRNGYQRFTPIPIPADQRKSEGFFDKHLPRTSFPLPEDRSIGDALLWSSSGERQAKFDEYKREELKINGNRRGRGLHMPDVFIYGVHYNPAPEDLNLYRTVLISNLPKDIKLRDVLARVRGGMIYSSILADTRSITESMSALVIFTQEAHAEAYVSYTFDHSLHFGSANTQATVTLINTPTRPIGPKLRRIFELKQSRILIIPSFPKECSLSHLQRDLACGNNYRAASLLELYIDEHQTLHLEFSSIYSASSAYRILSNWENYRCLCARFMPDPCEGALEELELELPSRLSIIPRIRIDDSDTSEDERFLSDGSGDDGRKPFSALTNQKVEILEFNGAKLKNSSWADEVEEAEAEAGVDVEREDNARAKEASFTGRIAPPNSPSNLRTVGSLEIGSLDEMMLVDGEKTLKPLKARSVGMSLESLLGDSDDEVKETNAGVGKKTDIPELASEKDFLDSTTKSKELKIINERQPSSKTTPISPSTSTPTTPLSINPTPTSVLETTLTNPPTETTPTKSHALPTPTGTPLTPSKIIPFSLPSTAKNWKEEGHSRPPVGFAGSKYARLVLGFEDSGVSAEVPTLRREGASLGQEIAKEREEGKGQGKVVNDDEIVLDLDEDGVDAEEGKEGNERGLETKMREDAAVVPPTAEASMVGKEEAL